MSEHSMAPRPAGLTGFAPIGLREMLDAAPEILFACDADGRFQWLNPALAILVGVRASDLLGRHVTEVLAASDRAHTVRHYLKQRDRRQEITTRTLEVQRADGGTARVHAVVRGFERMDGDFAFVGVAHAIDAESARPAHDAAPDDAHEPGAVVLSEHDAELVARLHALESEAAEAQTLRFALEQASVDTVELDRLREQLRELSNASSERDVLRGEVGRLEEQLAAARAAFAPRGPSLREEELELRVRELGEELETARAAARASSANDDAQATAARERQAAEHEVLRLQVLELTAQTEDARAQAQMKGEHLATMSHELRTPMNGVMGMTRLLLETELDNEQRGLVEVIRQSSQALLTLVNDTLDFSRLEAGKLEIEHIDFDLRVTFEEVATLLAPLANEKGLQLDAVVHHEVPSRLHGDPGRLRQVLLNLGGNAIKFTEQGSVTLRVDRLIEDDDRVSLRFSVVDTGIGIPADAQGMLFEAFSQTDPSIARRFGGSGLGLSIARQLVTLMGGEVGVESAPGQGSTFWFNVPYHKQMMHALPELSEDVVLRGQRVLVADASRASRESLAEILAMWGCRVETLDGADEALARLREAATQGDPFQIALIERHLGSGDGENLGWQIHGDERLDATRTLLLTSMGSRGDAARAQSRGFSAYLLKPVQWPELYDALVAVLSHGPAAVGEGAPPLVTRHSIAEARRNRVRVLVVEDSRVNQLVTDMALRRLGYSVEVASTAGEALQACERRRFDLILFDMCLPDMDGFKAVPALRARERGGARTPIVAMTGLTMPGDRERVMNTGVDEYLPKPIDLGVMCEMVERLTRPASGDAEPVAAGAPAPGEPPLRLVEAPAPAVQSVLDATDVQALQGRTGAALSDGLGHGESEAIPPIDSARLEESSMGIPSLRDALLQTFLADVHPKMDRLAEAVRLRDARRIEFEAHGLRGMSATVGAMLCSDVFESLERAGREEKLDDLASLLARAVAEVEHTEQYVRRLGQILKAA